jgi:Tfp pilus assembly protein PilO
MEERQNKKKGRLNTILNEYYRLFATLIFLLVVALGIWFLIWPEISKSQKIAKEFLPEKMQEIDLLGKYTGKIKDLETLVSNIDNQYGRSLDLLRQVLPAQANVPELIAQVDALTRKSGFEMNSIDITESGATSLVKKGDTKNIEINNTPLRLVNINLSVTGGSYPSFKILLDNIEKNIRLLDLNSVSFSGGTSEAVGYNLNLRTYYFTDPLTTTAK